MALFRCASVNKKVCDAQWDDRNALRTLGTREEELLLESQDMSLDALRVQNRAIEEYVFRLVRQRDDLKQAAKLAEERDSYLCWVSVGQAQRTTR